MSTLHKRASAAAHAPLPQANPMPSQHVAQLLTILTDRAPKTAVDTGCGPATLALDLARVCDAHIYAVDSNPDFIARAQQAVANQSLVGTVQLILSSFMV